MPNKTNSQSGFTLIEVLIYSLILSFALLLLSNLLFMLISFWQNSQAKKNILKNSVFIENSLYRDLRGSYTVLSPDSTAFGGDLILLSTASGQISYETENGVLKRNGEALSDREISLVSSGQYGFRLVGKSVDWRLLINSLLQPINGTASAAILKGSAIPGGAYE